MKIIAIIPARGGSKGIKDKNIKLFNGKPLISYSIKNAQESKLIDSVYVSTDSQKIYDISSKYFVNTIHRPKEISGDLATTESVIDHVLKLVDDVDIFVLLQCTSPIRPKGILDKAIQKLIDTKSDSLLSTTENHKFFWSINENDKINPLYDYKNRPRRQDIKEKNVYENGSFYISTKEQFLKSGNRLGGNITYINMDIEYSFEIDTLNEFYFMESIYKGLNIE